MPFVTRSYEILEPVAAFLFLMRAKGYTQAQAQKAIDRGRLSQNGRAVGKGEKIYGYVELSEFEPCDMPLEPVFYNEYFCVYDKPHNLLTHPKGRFYHHSLNDALKKRFGNGANAIHRLDKQTSGLVLCASNPVYESQLKSLMEQRQINKTYLAIVQGELKQEMLISERIARGKVGDLRIKSFISPKGKPSRTLLRPLAYHKPTDSTLVSAIALTGRTHQIRLHCAHVGHRILGDPLYGVDEKYSRFYLANNATPHYEQYFGAPHLCLNAHTLSFIFKERAYYFVSCLRFECAPHFSAIWDKARDKTGQNIQAQNNIFQV